ncbi:MAG TPA: sugar ABC transporter permease [Caldilineaceae bacterium]|nr:sugar ABC transporter permease [Caldilineaceae bacterium]
MAVTSSARTTPQAAVGTTAHRRAWRHARETLFWYFLLAPSLLIIFGFSVVPMFWSIYYSFTKGGMLGKHTFVGIQNYITAFQHPIFLRTLKNTTLYAVLTVPTVIVIALVVAILIFQLPRMQGFFRGTVYFPLITPVVIAANIWAYMVNRDFGPLNHALSLFGVPRVDWLGNPTWAIPAIVMMEIWRGFGFYVIILFAALQAIPKELYEAGRIDGASFWRIVWSITIPLLRPALGFCFIMATIFNFQLFDAVYVLTKGGPAWSTATVSWYVYQQAFEADNIGFASTMGVVLLVIILTLSLIQLRFFRSDIEY